MNRTERAIKYIQSAGGAVSGNHGHDHTLGVACQVLRKIGLDDPEELLAILRTEHNPQCDPPWSEKELRHKVDEAFKLCAGEIGSEDQSRDSAPFVPSGGGRVYQLKPREELPEKHKGLRFKSSGVKYQPYPEPDEVTGLYDPDEVPSNGALWLMSNAFEPGEFVRVATAFWGRDGKELPSGGGMPKTASEWIRLLSKSSGRWNKPGGLFAKREDELTEQGQPGVYVAVNPYGTESTKDENISSFRHALLEFDDLPKAKQWEVMHESGLPITCIIDSGKRSLHAWVRVDAADRAEYNERVAIVYEYFSEYAPDRANKNPGRLSRAPEALRGSGEQTLLAKFIGAGSFVEWLAKQEEQGLGESIDAESILAFDSDNDPNCLIGARWLCRGGSCVFVAQSGIGKSSLMTQAAFTWGLGLPLFGIAPLRPLRSLIIQAENDLGDIAEQAQGVFAGMGLDPFEGRAKIDEIFERVKFHRDTVHTSDRFCATLAKLIEKHSPDLVWIDPLLSFLGGDVSKQEVCSKFLRNGLNPIAEATGVTFMIIHHTGKPPKDAKALSGWTANDYAYLGAGSSELTNWARAVCVITQTSDDNTYLLQLAKRGGRAGATDEHGNPTTKVHLAQATDGTIFWKQIGEPEGFQAEQSKPRKPKIDDSEPLNAPDIPETRLPAHLEALRYWFDKCPDLDVYAALEPLWGQSGLKWSEITGALTAYARQTGNGPVGNSTASKLAMDICHGVKIHGTDQPFVAMVETPPKKEGGRSVKRFTVNRPDISNIGEDFSDVPEP